MTCTEIQIKLSGSGCGLEVADGIVYSIGNQTINATIQSEDCGCTGLSGSIMINSQVVPVSVCDGEVITVSLSSPSYTCGTPVLSSTSCSGSMSLFLVSRITSNNKIRI